MRAIEIDQVRLYVYKTAWLIDQAGTKAAQSEIAGIKVAAPAVATRVIDRAIEVFGGAGVSNDTPLAYFYAWAGFCASSTVPTRCTAGQSPARNCVANDRSQGEKTASLTVYSRPHRVTYAVRVWLAP